MKHKTPFLWAAVIALSVVLTAQAQEFARVLRNGEQATLSVFGLRPVDLAAQKLVDEFGVALNVEDPVYMFKPEASLLEMRFDVSAGSLPDVGGVVRDLVNTANAQLPFAYRIDNDGDVFTLVPSRTRDEQGRSIELTPILDRHVTIPRGTRPILEHVNLLTKALEQQTGVRLDCCQVGVGGIPWGRTIVSFEARDEPARSALLRLIRSEPARDRLVRNEQDRTFHFVKSEPGHEHWRWTLRCQPGEAWCFINVAAIPEPL